MDNPQITVNSAKSKVSVYLPMKIFSQVQDLNAQPSILSVVFKARDQICINYDKASHPVQRPPNPGGFQWLTFADGTISRVTWLADTVVPTHGVETERVFITVVLVCYTFVML